MPDVLGVELSRGELCEIRRLYERHGCRVIVAMKVGRSLDVVREVLDAPGLNNGGGYSTSSEPVGFDAQLAEIARLEAAGVPHHDAYERVVCEAYAL